MTRRLLPLAAVAAAALAGCGDEPRFTKIAFAEVPDSSGFAFRHELPGGALDNLAKSAMGGAALLDYDDDGRIDVFCVSGGWDAAFTAPGPRPATPATCRLYRNLGGMRFEDVTERAGVGFDGFGLGACVGDADGDGRPDLFVSAYGRPPLYRNRGDGTFEEIGERAGLAPGLYAGAAFLDYDRDGHVDLFASQYVDPRESAPDELREGQFPGPGAYRGQPARLWRNRGDGTFEDVTARAGVGKPGKGMGAVATDVDDDGWTDVFVANDAMENFVWRNQGDGTFADAAPRLGLAFGLDAEPRAAMGITVADLDGDGRLDYLVPDTRGGSVYVARDRYFTDRSRDWGIAQFTMGVVGWTDVVLDVDDDGLPDVYKVHGDLRTLVTQASFVLWNRGTAESGAVQFHQIAPGEGKATRWGVVDAASRGGLACDFDDDGREDLLVLALQGRARLLRNVTEPVGNWVKVRLRGRAPNTTAIGARLTARCGDRPVVREASGSAGYVSAGDPRMHFGLGDEDELRSVRVRWPDGSEQSFGDLEAGRVHELRQR